MLSSSVLLFFHPFPSPTFVLAATTIVLTHIGTTCCAGRGHVGGNLPKFVPTLAEQRVVQAKWLKGTLTLRSDRFRERSDVTGELCGLPCGCQGTAKFEFKLPSVHSVVRGHPTVKESLDKIRAQSGQVTSLDETMNHLTDNLNTLLPSFNQSFSSSFLSTSSLLTFEKTALG
ncbi:hypothetical protein E2C01_059322 [Portunus trituberculatus]|uniref:Uncharacterized protein n=1 Tax=Portunus trituberculatus TaxID=210409 RepID=A0A5B7GXU7_PORTR|nr:hypothetical protein [Portunus trituberculatus]